MRPLSLHLEPAFPRAELVPRANFYAVLDREDMNRSGVFPNWLDAEYVKKSASGYGKYGTKQDCIEGALEELDTMIKHYNLICMKKLGNK